MPFPENWTNTSHWKSWTVKETQSWATQRQTDRL